MQFVIFFIFGMLARFKRHAADSMKNVKCKTASVLYTFAVEYHNVYKLNVRKSSNL